MPRAAHVREYVLDPQAAELSALLLILSQFSDHELAVLLIKDGAVNPEVGFYDRLQASQLICSRGYLTNPLIKQAIALLVDQRCRRMKIA